jgi:oxygen-independent coproporphyrinogen III oxidase
MTTFADHGGPTARKRQVTGSAEVIGARMPVNETATAGRNPPSTSAEDPQRDSGAGIKTRLDAAVPRYTSYPTTPHFRPDVTADTYRDWLAGISADDTLSLYFHVPFCKAMCWYCGCHTKVVRRYQPVADYAALLVRELALVAGELGALPEVAHVHWGGGTPTMLEARDFAALMETARLHFRFAADAEVAVEIDPRALTQRMAEALAAAGITRASLGVQDFNDHVQRAINRVQPFAVTADAVARLRDCGVAGVNFDLMYGLPVQTVADVVRTVDRAVTLKPDRLALFGYAHVPWMKTHQRMIDETLLPGGEERLTQAEAAARPIAAHGYRRIGLDHFARPGDALATALDEGRLKRNFQGYTTDRAPYLLGFGASAIGNLPQGYVQNEVPLAAYGRAIAAGRLATVRGFQLSADDRLRRDIIERLMCGLEVDLEATVAAHGANQSFAAEMSRLDDMAANGAVEIAGSRVRVSERGRPWMRTVASVFDRYLETGKGRHSRAV